MPFGLVVLKLLMNGLFLWTHFCENSFRKLAVRNTTFLGGKIDFFFLRKYTCGLLL